MFYVIPGEGSEAAAFGLVCPTETTPDPAATREAMSRVPCSSTRTSSAREPFTLDVREFFEERCRLPRRL